MLSKILENYDELFGEKHHEICSGKNCECHKVVKQFISQSIEQALNEVVPEKEVLLEVDRLDLSPETAGKNMVNINLSGSNRMIDKIKENIKNFLSN